MHAWKALAGLLWHVGIRGAHLATLSIQVLLMFAEGADLAEQLVRLDEESGAQQKGEEVRPIGIIFLGGHHMLHQGFQRARHQIPVPIDQRLKRNETHRFWLIDRRSFKTARTRSASARTDLVAPRFFSSIKMSRGLMDFRY